MNKMIVATIAALMAIAASACARDTVPLLQGEAGRPVELSLNANPSTGYSWMIKHLPDGLIFVSEAYQQSETCKERMVGCGGEAVFHFIGEKAGEGTLRLLYGRPFDPSSWQEKEILVLIR